MRDVAAKSGHSGLSRVTLTRIAVDQQDAEILQRGVPRRRQCQRIGLAGLERIGTGHHVEQQRQVGGAARHRTDHRKVAAVRQRRKRRRGVTAIRHQRHRRLVRIDAAMERRHAQRAADIGAERQRAVARGERGRRSTGRAARRAFEIVGIVGGAVDLVIALPVAEPERHIGLAEDDAAGVLDPRDRQRVFGRLEILLRGKAPGRRQAGDVVGFLHGQGDAEQRLALATRERSIGGARRSKRAIEVAHADRVDLAVVALDAADRILRQFDGRNLLRRQRGCDLDGGLETPW
jgi:hypothetical protein